MRVSVTLSDDLGRELEAVRRREQRSRNGVIREAIAMYVKQRQRRAAGEALKKAAAENPLSPEQARAALEHLQRDREHSDRS